MQKTLVLILFLASLGIFGFSMYKYTSSGVEVFAADLAGKAGQFQTPALDPAMSPARLFVQIKGEMHVQDVSADAYKYVVTVIAPDGVGQLQGIHTQSEKKTDQGPSFERLSNNHVVGTFDVLQSGVYVINWKVSPKKADIKSVSVLLRRNVVGMDIPMMALAGFCFVLGWIVLFMGRRKRN
jgi:hypothetical protein